MSLFLEGEGKFKMERGLSQNCHLGHEVMLRPNVYIKLFLFTKATNFGIFITLSIFEKSSHRKLLTERLDS